jgi:hypothetical protein
MNQLLFSRYLEHQEELKDTVVRFNGTYSRAISDASISITDFNNRFSRYLDTYTTAMQRLKNQTTFSKTYFSTDIDSTLSRYFQQQQDLINLFHQSTNLTNYFTKDSWFFNKYAGYFSSVLAEENVTIIDVSGIDEFSIPVIHPQMIL